MGNKRKEVTLVVIFMLFVMIIIKNGECSKLCGKEIREQCNAVKEKGFYKECMGKALAICKSITDNVNYFNRIGDRCTFSHYVSETQTICFDAQNCIVLKYSVPVYDCI